MENSVLSVLSWKNKQETGVIFLSLNLILYLVVLGGYSLISIVSSIGLVMIAAINILRFSKKAESENESFYISKETLEDVFVKVFELWHSFSDKVKQSLEITIFALLGLLLFSWLVETFTSPVLVWVSVLLAFTLTPQYYANKEIVDQQLQDFYEKFLEGKKTIIEFIPKYKANY